MENDQKKTIGNRLMNERLRFGWSQAEAARKAGVSFSAYRSYEDGRSMPNAESLLLLSECGVDVLYVVTGKANDGSLTPDEMTMLCYWRESPDELRAAWLAFHQTLKK
ncbi:helix-turn-helix domain-containing protein [Laribacter hongkongensis]|uniref:Transcriptional regulator n=2 Tax=Laribacter hongkongensis TaxID=168471 RepID=A0A248LJI3_9NEIS|nr:helix-turn-helix transcriptional regulator [Laribacter hongkongensis]ASJ24333.1 transcriptional regulator [Laribacter hongkongensis]MCG9042015.1 helix-turn-helix domain-containing protein [Laribacter hongkongensis]MCG9087737.1 helix-turn-helix domain-containing protein [Laribacter hongkongensis]MCG9110852.1 helix-turn-helix domain-containing protein [Laribacter hongkongensis]MCG9122696.1 helix-turn-helix domain-containing protein [Laribacter hongkongensis]